MIRIGIFVNTPAQVHFYRHILKLLRQRGNLVYLLARDYGETLSLLNELNIDYYIYSKAPKTKYGKIFALPFDILNAYYYLKDRNIDILTGFGVYDAFTSVLLGVPSIIFNDSEPSVNSISYSIQFRLYMPFIDVMITPDSFREDLGDKHIKVSSFKEMAYLHPNYFQPNNCIFKYLGLSEGDDYAILRFNAFDAVHDFSVKGFSDKEKIELVHGLEEYMNVFISAESGIPKSLKSYIAKIPKSRIHDAIYYAKLLVTDTQTMATEGAILGTPTIRYNTFVGSNDMGNFLELEHKFKLLFNTNESQIAIDTAIKMAKDRTLKRKWQLNREYLLCEKTDLSEFMCRFLENYPRSYETFKYY